MESKVIVKEINYIEYKEYEAWLEEMESEGWNLVSIKYCKEHTFQKGNKRKIRYCLEFNEDRYNQEYIDLIKGFGWGLMIIGGVDYIWYKEYSEERPELYGEIERVKEWNKTLKKDLFMILVTDFIIITSSLIRSDNIVRDIVYTLCVILVLDIIIYWRNIKNSKRYMMIYLENKKTLNKYSFKM